jgi:predicted PurR-regulated permease PerM
LALIDTRTARVLITVLAFAVALAFVYLARHTLVAFLFAVFFAYLIDPLVSAVQGRLRGRGRAIAAIYLLLIIVVVIFFFFVGPKIVRESQRLVESLPGLVQRVGTGQIAVQIGSERGWSFETQQKLQHFLATHRGDVSRYAARAGTRIAEIVQNIWWLLLIPILAIFFLKDGRVFSDAMLSLISTRPQREFAQGVLSDLNEMLAHFIRAQLILAALSLVVYASVLALLRVPYAAVLGTLGGMLEFIPVVGPLIAAVLILSISFLYSYPHLLALVAFLAAWRVIQDYAVSPRIMGERMELHPLAAIFGVLAGGELAGVIGVYLSIPIMASLRIVWRRWRIYAEKRKFGPINEYAFGSGDFPPRP